MPVNIYPYKKAYFSALTERYPGNRAAEEGDEEFRTLNLNLEALGKDFSADHMESIAALFSCIPRSAFDLDSPNRMLPHLFGDKWTPLLMMIMSTGSIRYAALKRTVNVFLGGEEISKFMLTKKLRELERNGLLIRRQTEDVPPKVDYTLTELGYNIIGKLMELFGYIYSQSGAINSARKAYDQQIKRD